jgi:Ran GTPase-activating protein (RanGAP) involved in mRNA processing and transport
MVSRASSCAADGLVRCPVLVTPNTPGDPARLDPLVARLADPMAIRSAIQFPAGTLQADGRLDLCKQELGPAAAARVAAAAVASPHVSHLLLGTDGLGEQGTAALAVALRDEHHLHTLYLGCNGIDAPALAPLAAQLGTDNTVKALWLKRNPLGDDGVRVLADMLRQNHALRTLDLTHTGVGTTGVRALMRALLDRPVGLARLYLGGNQLGPDDAEALATLLQQGKVTSLYLAAGRLGDTGARVLAEALPQAAGITLGLGSNGIGPAGIAALAEGIPSIDALDLSRAPSAHALAAADNLVGDGGAAALAAALPSSGLRRLDVRHTSVTGRGARILLGAVRADANSVLESLLLGKGVPRRTKRMLAPLLRPSAPPADDVAAIVSVYR